MTTMVAWAGVDSRAVSSLYIASDSRITWGNSNRPWDSGRKTFASKTEPWVFGYTGDVLFPSLALSSIVDRIDAAAVPAHRSRPFGWIGDHVHKMWADFPAELNSSFTMFMGLRVGSKMSARFRFGILSYSDGRRVDLREVEMPPKSAILELSGTGSPFLITAHKKWMQSSAAGTSRAVYSAFCETVVSGNDSRSGGAPQLVGMTRVGAASTFGVAHGGARFISGSPIRRSAAQHSTIDWYNDLFERSSGRTASRLPGAKKH